jgi:hypothetical protein
MPVASRSELHSTGFLILRASLEHNEKLASSGGAAMRLCPTARNARTEARP